MTHTAETKFATAKTNAGTSRFSIRNLIDWLLSKDAAYRQRKQLERASPEALRDMGIDPNSVNRFQNRQAFKDLDQWSTTMRGGW